MRGIWMAATLAALGLSLGAAARPAPTPGLEVTLGTQASGPLSGRLIVIAVPASRAESTVTTPGVNGAPATRTTVPREDLGFDGTFIATQTVKDWRPGTSLRIDTDGLGKPGPLSALAAGSYAFQAILDVNDNFAFQGGIDGGDLATTVARANLPGPPPRLVFDRPAKPIIDPATMTVPAGVRAIDFVSPILTAFNKTPTHIRGFAALPPDYATSGQTYPAVYQFAGWSTLLSGLPGSAGSLASQMAAKRLPPMIWLLLDHHPLIGTHEFADSATNGPWGQALTEELIPYLEKIYRMDGRPSGRFLTGHSSGGWAALWAQVRYPKVFGGTWPASPDPSTFSNFAGIDILAPNANFYHTAAGKPLAMMRAGDTVLETWQEQARQEDLMGNDGGYINSYERVFSPKGSDGQPKPLFDRNTGAIDPQVARYWRDNYDMAFIIQRDWARLKPDLDGKIHLTVGDQDNYLYDGPAHVLKAALDRVGARSDFTFIPGGGHGASQTPDVIAAMAQQMYAIARPGSGLTPAPAAPPTRPKPAGG